MKPLLLIAALLAINAYAQTYPMLSTTTNRTVTGGVTNLALLNGTNTFTGTNYFTQDSGRVVFRKLASTNNLFLEQIDSSRNTVGIFTTSNFTYTTGTASNLLTITLPPLRSNNSRVGVVATGFKTNSIVTSCFLHIAIGTNDTFAGVTTHTATGSRALSGWNAMPGTEIFRNTNSFTTQIATMPAGSIVGTPAATTTYQPANYVDTSAAWTLTVGVICNTSVGFNTNLFFSEIAFFEAYEIP